MYEGPVQDLIDELGRLPGIGPKSAQRLAFHILAADPDDVMRLAAILKTVKDTVKFCEICFNVSEDTQCRICRDPRRDETAICVVEEAKDVVAVERTREFRGRYHVLGGAISPIDGIGPADLKIRELCLRLADGTVTEVILATDPNLEGEATATYLSRLLLPMGVKVSGSQAGCRLVVILSTPTRSRSDGRSRVAATSTPRPLADSPPETYVHVGFRRSTQVATYADRQQPR